MFLLKKYNNNKFTITSLTDVKINKYDSLSLKHNSLIYLFWLRVNIQSIQFKTEPKKPKTKIIKLYKPNQSKIERKPNQTEPKIFS